MLSNEEGFGGLNLGCLGPLLAVMVTRNFRDFARCVYFSGFSKEAGRV